MFGCMPIFGGGYCGYNPKLSDTVTGFQLGIAGLNGLTNIFEAKNNGADTGSAIAYGLSNATVGMGNALFGNIIDKSTHSYLGTTMNSVAPMLTDNNPYATTPLLANTAMFSTMMQPTYMPMTSFGCYSMWSSPMMFGGPMMLGGGMPMFGRFHCCC